jgi:hypothetical protein
MIPGQSINVPLSFTNTGTMTWYTAASTSHPVVVSYHWLNGACPGSTTVVASGVKTALPGTVAPGGSVTNLSSRLVAPNVNGTYCLQWDLARSGVTWFSAQGATMMTKTVKVAPWYSVTWGANNLPASIAHAATANVSVSFTNSGSMTWFAGGSAPVLFSYHWYNGACTANGTVAVATGLKTTLPGDVLPGGAVTSLATKIKAPATAGTYCVKFDLLRSGIAWFSDKGAAVYAKTVTIS